MRLRVGSLCTGYGGLEMGLELAGVDVDLRWTAEFDPALKPLDDPWAPNLGDLTTVDWSGVERVDLVTAGFPCQPFSAAGSQLAEADPRYLWPQVLRCLREVRPGMVLLENVRNLPSMRKGEVWRNILDDLGKAGFAVRWLTLGACAVGAAHHRHRVFALGVQRGYETDDVERLDVQQCGARKGSTDLLPTMTARDVTALLPTPRASDHEFGGRQLALDGRTPGGYGADLIDLAVSRLLPTPRAGDAELGATYHNNRGEPGAVTSAVQPERWGRFAAAVARHESAYGPAPAPTEPNRNGAPRLSAAFAEWLMCIPAGHVTGVLDRRAALKAIGNGVCPPQAAAAWRLLIDERPAAAPVDTSLGVPVASRSMTTTNDQIREIQNRDAEGRGRVIAATMALGVTVDPALIEAAMMELAAFWREQAAWWLASGKRGGKGTAAELTQAAGRLAGFAVGLSTRPVQMPAVDLPSTPEPDPINCERCDTDQHRCPGCGDVVAHGQVSCAPCDVFHQPQDETGERCADGLHPTVSLSTTPSGRTVCTACGADLSPPAPVDTSFGDALSGNRVFASIEASNLPSEVFEAAVQAELAGLEVERTQHLDPVTAYLTGASDTYDPEERADVQPSPVPSIIDNPFTSPNAPGAGARPPVAALPYSVLPVIAAQLEPRTQLSHSFVETFENCSLRSMLERASRHGLIGPRRPGWSLIGGNAFHAAVEDIERDVVAHPGRIPVSSRGINPASNDTVIVDVDQAFRGQLDLAINNMQDELAGSAYADPSTWYASNSGKEGYDWWRVEGALMLHRYLEFHGADFRSKHTVLRLQPLNSIAPAPVIEQEFVTSIAADAGSGTSALTTKGFIDIVWLEPPQPNPIGRPRLIIADWKTGSRRPTSTFQLGEYAHALTTLLPAGLADAEIVGQYWLARKGEYTPAVPLLAKHPAEEMTYRYRQAALGSSLGLAAPHVTDMCTACGVKDYCPAQATR